MKNSILHQIYAGYVTNFKKQNSSFQKGVQIFHWLFFIRDIYFLLSIKNVLIEIKNSVFPTKYTRCEKKMLRNKIVYFKKIYNSSVDHFT